MSVFQQVEDVLRIVVPQVAKMQGKEFHRSIRVTVDISDMAVSNGVVRVHPASATASADPIPFCNRIIELCEEYDRRIAEAHEVHLLELQEQVKEWYRRARKSAGPAEASEMFLRAKLEMDRYLP